MDGGLDPKRLVLVDRDGVINVDSDSYIKSAAEWHPIPGSLETIARLNQNGIDVVVITNQSGIGRGYFNEEALSEMHDKMAEALAQLQGHVSDIFFCPHRPEENCDCRKPEPGLLDQLQKKYNIALDGVPFIGDTGKDLHLAKSKNCLPILVKTGKGQVFFEGDFQSDPVKKDTLVFENLQDAGNYLLTHFF